MRIISDFKDYYDCIQGVSLDKDVVYHRQYRIFGEDDGYEYWSSIFRVKFGVVGFCGKKYPFLKIERRFNDSFVFYSFDKADEFIQSFLTKKELDVYFGKPARYHMLPSTRKGILNKWNEFQEQINTYANNEEIHFKYKTPIFVIPHINNTNRFNWTNSVFEIDAQLSQYEFFKVVDNYTAFQEIYMYISGILGGNFKPIPEVKDEDMIEAKGFDKKYSFRKDKK